MAGKFRNAYITFDPTIPREGIDPKDRPQAIQKYVWNRWGQPKCPPIGAWLSKLWNAHTKE